MTTAKIARHNGLIELEDGWDQTDGYAHTRLNTYDAIEGVTRVAMLSWDTGTLSWVRFTGASSGGGGAVTVADGADVAQGAKADAAWDGAAATATLIAIQKYTGGKTEAIRALLAGGLSVTGPLTDAQLRASAIAVSGPLTQAQLTAAALATEATLALIKAKTDNLDVVLSTRLKPADTLAAVTNLAQLAGQAIAMNTGVRSAGTQRVTIATDDLVPVSGPLTAAQTLAAITNLVQMNGQAITMGTGVRAAGTLRVTVATDDVVPVNGDVDHDAVNTLKNIQMAGHASPADVPPSAVSANGDRVRLWADRSGSSIIRARKIRETYTVVFRLAETGARLDQTFTQVANTNKQWGTIHHTASATKELRLLKWIMYITADTTAGIQGVFELRKLDGVTAPATGNPAVTPTPHRIGGGAAEAVALYLPTTQGSEATVNSPAGHVPFDTGISGAVSTVNPVPILIPVTLYDASQEDPEETPPTIPVGTAGGWAAMVRTVGVPVLRITMVARFTEEVP